MSRLFHSSKRGICSGLSMAWLLLRIMVPTMAIVQVLKALGALEFLAHLASPVMKIFALPGEAALAILTGGVVNIYAAIAVAVNIPMTAKSMTVLAIMVLIAHNLIVETAVQSRAGTPAAVMLTVRISAALVAGFIFARIIPDGGVILGRTAASDASGLGQVLVSNVMSLLRITIIVITLMLLVEISREFGLMDRFMNVLQWPMKTLGLHRKTAFVAAVGLVLGLAYGAGLIIDETKKSSISSREILATNVFLGTSHALIEDSLVFAAVGANLLWIVVGRLVFGSIFLRLVMPLAERWAGVRKIAGECNSETISP
ncbi:hypothetical protein BMS3Abin14_00165 [bacterium BMS3Abin14]|nr:hypothetical protein BMS3Abin14_00165 [bacterium BMS3Abin14]